MANVGWIGAGRLGLACSFAMAAHGKHEVSVFDINADRVRAALADPDAYGEAGLADLIATVPVGDINTFGAGTWTLAASIAEVVNCSEVVFVAVQTPHDPRYGGEAPMPGRPVDFEYGYLIQAVRDIATAARAAGKPITIAVVSTVLPGTTRAHLKPLCGPLVQLAYTPAYIAQSTVIRDYTSPEYVLIGVDDPADAVPVAEVFTAIHDRPHHIVGIESAELLKVAYNCAISSRIVLANTIMEIAHKTGADCDEVSTGLEMATDRIASGAYLRGGMGDQGACHPRDNQAMSWLAERLDLSVDLMGFVSQAREHQSQWLASVVAHWARLTGLPVMVLGRAYKPNIALTFGSAALLLARHLAELDVAASQWDPHVDGGELPGSDARVFAVATKHDAFRDLKFPAGSVVIDPHGFMADQPGVTVVRVGRKT